MKQYIGIDIGSTSAKTVVMDENRNLLYRFLQPTGWNSIDTADSIQKLLAAHDVDVEKSPCIATGYGRIAVSYADKCITEITCHARGACHIFDQSELLVIDIGGQDTKIISVLNRSVSDFLMNDKCSAGTGRFLEIMANTLNIRLDELMQLASLGSGTSISSMCTVFAESEVITLIGKGENKENIAFAVVQSIIQKVSAQANKLKPDAAAICLTGGLCESSYICDALSSALNTSVVSNSDGRYAGALGAALFAMDLVKE